MSEAIKIVEPVAWKIDRGEGYPFATLNVDTANRAADEGDVITPLYPASKHQADGTAALQGIRAALSAARSK